MALFKKQLKKKKNILLSLQPQGLVRRPFQEIPKDMIITRGVSATNLYINLSPRTIVFTSVHRGRMLSLPRNHCATTICWNGKNNSNMKCIIWWLIYFFICEIYLSFQLRQDTTQIQPSSLNVRALIKDTAPFLSHARDLFLQSGDQYLRTFNAEPPLH